MTSVRFKEQYYPQYPMIFTSDESGGIAKSDRAFTATPTRDAFPRFVSRQALNGAGAKFSFKLTYAATVANSGVGVRTSAEEPTAANDFIVRVNMFGGIIGENNAYLGTVQNYALPIIFEIDTNGTTLLIKNGTMTASVPNIPQPLYLGGYFSLNESHDNFSMISEATVTGATFPTFGAAPAAPTIAATSGHKRNHIEITDFGGGNGVEIFRSTSAGVFNYEAPIVTEWRHPVYEDKEQTNGQIYYYRARATVDGLNPSAASNEASATPTLDNIPAVSEEIGFILGAPVIKPFGDAPYSDRKTWHYDFAQEQFVFKYGCGLPKFHRGETINGTLSVTNGSKEVAGAGTNFKTVYRADSYINIPNGDGTYNYYTVRFVNSDTSLTLWENYTGATGTGRLHRPSPPDTNPFNDYLEGQYYYYDLALSLYQLYYRSGNTYYRTLAREGAQMFARYNEWTKATAGGGNYNAPPRNATMFGIAICALEHDATLWTTVKGFTDSRAYFIEYRIDARNNGDQIYWFGEDMREGSYLMQYSAILGKCHPTESVRTFETARCLRWFTDWYLVQANRYPDRVPRFPHFFYVDGNYRAYHYHQPFINAIAHEALVMLHKLTGDETVKELFLDVMDAAITYYDDRTTDGGYDVRAYPYSLAHSFQTPIVGDWLAHTIPSYAQAGLDREGQNFRSRTLTEPIPAYILEELGNGSPRFHNAIVLGGGWGYAYYLTGDEKYINHGNELLDATYAETDAWTGGMAVVISKAKNVNEGFRRASTFQSYRDIIAPEVEGLTQEDPPTFVSQSDETNEFVFAPASGKTFADCQYSINGSGYQDCASTTIQVGDINVPVNGLLVRTKAVPGVSTASTTLKNSTAFQTSGGGEPVTGSAFQSGAFQSGAFQIETEPTAYILTADAGTFALTGQTANLTANRRISSEAGSFALTGQAANLTAARRMTADAGAYALTGQAANFNYARFLTALAGTFAATGQAATFARTYRLAAEAGAYALAGQSATLGSALNLVASAGSFALAGQSVNFTVARKLTAEAGAFALSGQQAQFLADRRLAAEAGAFLLSGGAAAFAYESSTAQKLTDDLKIRLENDGQTRAIIFMSRPTDRVQTFELIVGDTHTPLRIRATDANNAPVDLAGCSAVFQMGNRANPLKVNKAATIDADQTANKGWMQYEFAGEDVNKSGTFQAEFLVTFPNGKTATFPRGQRYKLEVYIGKGVA